MKARCGSPAAESSAERRPHVVGIRLDPPGMVEEHARPQHLGCARPDLLLRPEQILAVLAAAGVGGVRGGEERERPLDAVRGHLAERIREERVPVAVAEVDRQIDPVLVELDPKRGDQRAVLGVDRADAAEELVVVGDLLQPLARDVAPAGHVLEEGDHVVHPLGPAERDDEDRVEMRLGERRHEPVRGWLERGLAHRGEPSRSRGARDAATRAKE